MKKKYIFWGLLACVMASCSNDELVEKTGLNHNEIKVTAVLEPKARVSFEADGDVTHAYWDEGDQITIYDESQGGLDYELTSMDEGGGTAAFAPLGNSVQYTEGTVYAIYPATPVVDGIAAIPNTDVWEEGKPMPFSYAYGKMDGATLVLEFHHLFAYLKLTLNAETVADSDVKEITGIQLSNTSATYPIAGVNGKYNFTQHNSTFQGGINSMVFNLKEPFTATGDAEKVVYIPVLTQPAGETITISVLSGTETLLTVTKETPESGFVAGNAYQLTLQSSSVENDSRQLLGAYFTYEYSWGEECTENYTFSYNADGKIEKVNGLHVDQYGISFEDQYSFEYFDEGKSVKASYTGDYESEQILVATLNDKGFFQEGYIRFVNDGSENDTLQCVYNDWGALTYLNYLREENEFTYDSNHDMISGVSANSNDTPITYDIVYGEVENKGNVLLVNMLELIDEEGGIEIYGLLGFLGNSSKHLPIQRIATSYDEITNYEWTTDEEGYPIKLIIKNEDENHSVTFTWSSR